MNLKVLSMLVASLIFISGTCFGSEWDIKGSGDWSLNLTSYDDERLDGVGYSAKVEQKNLNSFCPSAIANNASEVIVMSHSRHGTVGDIEPGKPMFTSGGKSRQACSDWEGQWTFRGKESRNVEKIYLSEVDPEEGWFLVIE